MAKPDHDDKKLTLNGVVVDPAKKVKLTDFKTRAEIEALVAQRRSADLSLKHNVEEP